MIFFFLVSIFLLSNNVFSQKTIDAKLQKIELEVAGGYWAGLGLNHLSIFQKQNSYISFSNGIGITQGVFELIKLSIAQKIHLGFNLGKRHSIEFGPGYALVFNLSGR